MPRSPRRRAAHHLKAPHRRHLTWAPHLPGAPDHLLPLGGRRSLPLLAQHLTARRRQVLERAEAPADRLLLLRRQGPELLPPAAQHLPLLRTELPPPLEALTRHRALLGVHAEPPLAAAQERLLTRRRERSPAVRQRAEQLPLLR